MPGYIAETGNGVAQQLLPDTLVHPNRFTDLLSHIARFLIEKTGMSDHPVVSKILYTLIVLLISIAAGFIVKWIVQKTACVLGQKIKGSFFSDLRKKHFFSKITYIIPVLLFLLLIRFTFVEGVAYAVALTNISLIILFVVIAISLNAFIDALWIHFDTRANKRKLPLKGLEQLVKGIVWIVVTIIALAIIINKSPVALLTGLGAFAAVLMLIFKDSILGVVASVQLSEYDTLHIGDWIKVPGTDANGTVLDTSLISVKVRNWDKTTTVLPSYSLVTGSFTNYSSMQESNTRLISRTIPISIESVRTASESMLASLSELPYMKEYIQKKEEEKAKGTARVYADPSGLANGSLETNLGLFRAYLKMYLRNNPAIDHDSTAMVFTDQMSGNGIPLRIYCFTATSAWEDYESIQSALFEHIAAVMPKFSLAAFQNESDIGNLQQALINRGIPASDIFGMPEHILSMNQQAKESK